MKSYIVGNLWISKDREGCTHEDELYIWNKKPMFHSEGKFSIHNGSSCSPLSKEFCELHKFLKNFEKGKCYQFQMKILLDGEEEVEEKTELLNDQSSIKQYKKGMSFEEMIKSASEEGLL